MGELPPPNREFVLELDREFDCEVEVDWGCGCDFADDVLVVDENEYEGQRMDGRVGETRYGVSALLEEERD